MSLPLGREGGLGGDNIKMLGQKIGSHKNRKNLNFGQITYQNTDLEGVFLQTGHRSKQPNFISFPSKMPIEVLYERSWHRYKCKR